MPSCKSCQQLTDKPIYDGPIRMGKFGEDSEHNHTVWQCDSCGSAFLDLPSLDYESPEYRKSVNGDESISTYYQLHDPQQIERLEIVGASNLRDKNVADIGCGAGSFLDLSCGLANNVIAVEPLEIYQTELNRKGYSSYSYTTDAVESWREQIDLAVSFAVVEHVEQPVEFLSEIRSLLKPGGQALISTPNLDDWLLTALPGDYGKFFFRRAHLCYFNARAIKNLAELAGFKGAEIIYQQQYDFSNAAMWLRDKKPTGLGHLKGLEKFNSHWKQQLQESGTANYLYARLQN